MGIAECTWNFASDTCVTKQVLYNQYHTILTNPLFFLMRCTQIAYSVIFLSVEVFFYQFFEIFTQMFGYVNVLETYRRRCQSEDVVSRNNMLYLQIVC